MTGYRSFVNKHLTVTSQAGDEWLCLCPFHDETNASFRINVDKGLFICFGCGAKGAFPALASHIGGEFTATSSATSVGNLREKLATIGVKPPPPKTLSPDWLKFWRTGEYIEKWATRAITDISVIDRFELGYISEDDALAIPIHDRSGVPLGAVRRFFDPNPGTPKYKYPKGVKISQCLYGFTQIASLEEQPKMIAVVEGSIDALASWQHGLPAIALLGARASTRQLELLNALSPSSIAVLTDNDQAGRVAASQLISGLAGSGIIPLVPSTWPSNCKDVGDMNEEEFKATIDSLGRCW
jgi:DNA primase